MRPETEKFFSNLTIGCVYTQLIALLFLSYFLLWTCYETQVQRSKWAKQVSWVGQLTSLHENIDANEPWFSTKLQLCAGVRWEELEIFLHLSSSPSSHRLLLSTNNALQWRASVWLISIAPKFAVPLVKQSSQVVAQHHNGGNKSGVAMVRWNFYYKSLTVLFPVVVPLGPSGLPTWTNQLPTIFCKSDSFANFHFSHVMLCFR